MSNSELRALARQQLGGNIFSNNWLYALVARLIISIITSAAGTFLPAIGVFLLTGALSFGGVCFFLNLARGNDKPDLMHVFSGFSNDYVGNLVLGLLIALFTFLWTLLLIIPGIVKSYSYSMAFYIKHDNPDYEWKKCIDESRRIMDGEKERLFLLDLSFLGWAILGVLCCGIGTLWVTPYMQAARANFYEDIKNK